MSWDGRLRCSVALGARPTVPVGGPLTRTASARSAPACSLGSSCRLASPWPSARSAMVTARLAWQLAGTAIAEDPKLLGRSGEVARAARCVSHQGRSKFPGATTAEVPAVGEPGTWPGLGGLLLSASGGAGTGPNRTKQLSASGGAGTGPTRAKQRGARRSCGPHSSHPPERYWRGPTQRSLPARPSGWSFRIFSIAVASVATAARVRVRFEGTKIRPACVRPWASRSAARGRKSLTLLVITARSSADAAPRTTLSLLPTRSPRSVTAMTS